MLQEFHIVIKEGLLIRGWTINYKHADNSQEDEPNEVGKPGNLK